MRNPLTRIYETIDGVIMKGADATLHAYNWTTGGTKTELANGLLTLAPILETTGFAIGPFPLTAIPIGVALLFTSRLYQKINTVVEKKEIAALKRQALDLFVEHNKNITQPQVGYAGGICASGQMLVSTQHSTPEVNYLVASGNVLRSTSHFVMRCDYLPPRKNCIKRGIEKLDDLVEKYVPKPQPLLQPTI